MTAATSDRAAMVDELITARAMILAGRVIGQDATAICSAIDRSLALLSKPLDAQPEQRNTHEILASIADGIEALLAEAKRSNSVAREGAVSSIAIEDMAKGPPKITTKTYQGSPLSDEDVVAALTAHQLVHSEADRRALAGWAETVNGLAAEGAVVNG